MARKLPIVQTENIKLFLNKKAGTITATSPGNLSGIPEASLEEWIRLAKAILEYNQHKETTR